MSAVTLFLDLILLTDVTSKGIFNSLTQNLFYHGIDEEYMKENLIAVACDGAAVLLGSKSGLKKLMQDKFPGVIFWHCANHRLELAVNDTVNEIVGVNRFKSFLDKLYVLYHASPKNSRELKTCAAMLETQLLKIGRILNTRWVASSFRTVAAVWNDFEALAEHFSIASADKFHRDAKDRSMYAGLLKHLTSPNFVLDLGLMCDALQELSELSEELQSRSINIYKAQVAIKRQINVFEKRINNPGPYYSKASQYVKAHMFEKTKLLEFESSRVPKEAINVQKFYSSLQNALKCRLVTEEDENVLKNVKVMYPENWPLDVKSDFTYAENEIRALCDCFHIDERKTIRAFRDYIGDQKMTPGLEPLKAALDVIPISSSECERGFSQMNLIMTPERSSLAISTVSALLFIRIVGPPLNKFDAEKYVASWISEGHHSATDKNSKERSRNKSSETSQNLEALWKIM